MISSMSSKIFRTQIFRDGSTCFIPVPFDPKPAFGKVRAPVKVTLNGYTYRSTIASMGGGLRRRVAGRSLAAEGAALT